jgi:hypothetical protein
MQDKYRGELNNLPMYVIDVIEGVHPTEQMNIFKFAETVEKYHKTSGLVLKEDCFYNLIKSIGVYNINKLQAECVRDTAILFALWVIFLRAYRLTLKDDKCFKYSSVSSFLSAYQNEFDDLDSAEHQRLFYSANWMDLCMSMIPARRNKAFYLNVIPKLVEGT